jgi:hypothetical protein
MIFCLAISTPRNKWINFIQSFSKVFSIVFDHSFHSIPFQSIPISESSSTRNTGVHKKWYCQTNQSRLLEKHLSESIFAFTISSLPVWKLEIAWIEIKWIEWINKFCLNFPQYYTLENFSCEFSSFLSLCPMSWFYSSISI